MSATPRKHILIIYTGGTIGSAPTQQGFAPQPGLLTTQLKESRQLANSALPTFDVLEYDVLIDSANATPDFWVTIARSIEGHYDDYDGFIILHGTDTLAYTASALSFMLENLAKPVILTGSQIPFGQLRSDALANILDSLICASMADFHEVGIVFNSLLLRGNRTTKTDCNALNAMSSPNYPALGHLGVQAQWHKQTWLPKSKKPLRVQVIHQPLIACVHIFPGINAQYLKHVLQAPLQGCVLKTYGTGNIPNDSELLKVIAEAHEQGIVIVNVSQCQKGTVLMQHYATGNALLKSGVVSGFDMTTSAALTKLYYLFSVGLDIDSVRTQFTHSLRGEMTSDEHAINIPN